MKRIKRSIRLYIGNDNGRSLEIPRSLYQGSSGTSSRLALTRSQTWSPNKSHVLKGIALTRTPGHRGDLGFAYHLWDANGKKCANLQKFESELEGADPLVGLRPNLFHRRKVSNLFSFLQHFFLKHLYTILKQYVPYNKQSWSLSYSMDETQVNW